MRDDLDKKLCADFPKLFSARNGLSSETRMCDGFPGDGWEPLIRECAARLEALNTSDDPAKWIVAFQVKEKFGTLRFYVDTPECERANWELIHQIIGEAERKSDVTCEECGQAGKQRGGRWILTLCEACDTKGKPK